MWHMKNVTLAIDVGLLKLARDYGSQHGTSLNALIRRLIEKTVRQESPHWVNDLESLCRSAKGRSHGKRWSRDELHERR